MNIVARSKLEKFWKKHRDSEQQLKAWYAEMKRSSFKSFHEIKEKYGTADPVGDKKVVFNVKGNKYRLIVKFDYRRQQGFVKFIGTHKEYDRINAEEL